MNPPSPIWPALLALVHKRQTQGIRALTQSQPLSRQTDLVLDLGLTGDDALHFMEEYAATFQVERGDFEMSNYFGPEGLSLFPRFKPAKPTTSITLGMLEQAARDGHWDSTKLHETSRTAAG